MVMVILEVMLVAKVPKAARVLGKLRNEDSPNQWTVTIHKGMLKFYHPDHDTLVVYKERLVNERNIT